MIESIKFENFKALRDATLPLSRFTLIVGPNGSGKSTVFQALVLSRCCDPLFWGRLGQPRPRFNVQNLVSARNLKGPVSIRICWNLDDSVNLKTHVTLDNTGLSTYSWDIRGCTPTEENQKANEVSRMLGYLRVFAFDPQIMVTPVSPKQDAELGENGQDLAGALSRLSDRYSDRFDALNAELNRWIPEFDRVTFDYTPTGERVFFLRLKESKREIPAVEVSHGTLFALALLSIAYAPDPPTVVCLEEPDRGLHPRLLRDVRDAIYRLTYPEQFGDDRAPVQVIATTHSPYLLDLFRDHPEEIVIAKKDGLDATFERLTDLPHYEEIIEESHLGELWYSGILGGVPADK